MGEGILKATIVAVIRNSGNIRIGRTKRWPVLAVVCGDVVFGSQPADESILRANEYAYVFDA